MKQHYVLGMIFVILVMLWIGSTLFKASSTKEGFTSQRINLNMCPKWAPQIQTAKGNTDCCEGTLIDGKCSANTFCTMSPAHDGVESCLEAWNRYFMEKSKQLCPSSIPNYYEDVRVPQNPKGCSTSSILENGSSPTNAAAKQCRIYPTERENRERMDSCFVERERLKVKCPRLSGFSSTVENVSYSPALRSTFGSYVCTYRNAIGQMNSCNDERSYSAMMDRKNPNWRMDRNQLAQLNNISCNTFLIREAERRRIEELRRRAEEERRRKEEQANRFRNFFNRFRQSSQSAMNRLRQAIEAARRKAQAEQEAARRRLNELQNRLRNCR